jgi:hypothetical protein
MKGGRVDSFRDRVNQMLSTVISSQGCEQRAGDGLLCLAYWDTRWLTMFGVLGHKGVEMLLCTFDLVEAVVIGAAGQA